MENLDPEVLIIIVTTIVCGLAIVIGTMVPTWVEGKAAEKAIEGMARQPDAAPQLRTAMLIALALLETASIYVLLIVLVLLFANPLINRFFGG
ncbi:MAG: ATP synthase F0 subunit C [Anaerolineaceae bacterium]|jgi:F-type H+-transporting ATPase subunit c